MRVLLAGPIGSRAGSAVAEGAGHGIGNGNTVAITEPGIRDAIGVAGILGVFGVAARRGTDLGVLTAAALVGWHSRAGEVREAISRGLTRDPPSAGETSAKQLTELVRDDALQAHVGKATERGAAALVGITLETTITVLRLELVRAIPRAVAGRAELGSTAELRRAVTRVLAVRAVEGDRRNALRTLFFRESVQTHEREVSSEHEAIVVAATTIWKRTSAEAGAGVDASPRHAIIVARASHPQYARQTDGRGVGTRVPRAAVIRRARNLIADRSAGDREVLNGGIEIQRTLLW
jgi:hypothetical protein